MRKRSWRKRGEGNHKPCLQNDSILDLTPLLLPPLLPLLPSLSHKIQSIKWWLMEHSLPLLCIQLLVTCMLIHSHLDPPNYHHLHHLELQQLLLLVPLTSSPTTSLPLSNSSFPFLLPPPPPTITPPNSLPLSIVSSVPIIVVA